MANSHNREKNPANEKDPNNPPQQQQPIFGYYPYYPQQYYYPPQPPVYYSPFEQYQPQQNEVTNPLILQMFANNSVQQQPGYYDHFGLYQGMTPIMSQVSEERRIEVALRALIFNQDEPSSPAVEQQNESHLILSPQNPVKQQINVEQVKSNIAENRGGTPQMKKVEQKKKKKTRRTYTFDNSREPLTEDMLELPDLKFTRDTGARISKVMIKLYKDLQPTQQEVEKKNKFFSRLAHIVKDKWPDAQLHLFGSSANQLCLKGSSDIDVCLVIKFEPRKRSNSRTQSVEAEILAQQEQQKQEELLQQQQQQQEDQDSINPQEDNYDDEEDEWPEEPNPEVRKKRFRRKYRKVPLTEEQAMKKNYVSQLTQFLDKHRMRNVKPLFNARVPIVKFVDPDSGLNCDICVNNILAVHNTRLLRAYATLDVRCSQLIYIIKYWATMREINQPYHGTLSSYSYVLLVINYLQTLPIPVLPVLQDAHQFPNVTLQKHIVDGLDANEYDCSFFEVVTDPEKANENIAYFPVTNTDSVGELLVGFFRHYAYEFNFGQNVVSIRLTPESARQLHENPDNTSRYLSKEEKKWTNYAEVRNAMCIEDPFEIEFNVGRSCTTEGLSQIQYELVRAYHLLCKQADLKTSVCARLSHNKV